MTPAAEQYKNGVAVGKMYASTPFWYWGFLVGQYLGAWQWWFKPAYRAIPGEGKLS